MRRRTDYIVVHCSATKPSSDVGVDEIENWHRAEGFDRIGYHSVIRRDGTLEFGRHFDGQGAHVRGQNMRSVSVCLVGGIGENGMAENNFTPAQMETLYYVVHMLRLAYPDSEVLGHRDLSPDLDGDGIIERREWVKDCPSFDVREWWESVGGTNKRQGAHRS